MKWQRFFLLLFLVPTLVYASYDSTDYNKDLSKISVEWTRHNELVEQFNRVKPDEREQGISLMRESIACCQRAIGHCDHIIKKINDKSSRDKKKWKDEKKKAEEDKDKLNSRINNLQTSINNVLRDIALSKAVPLYQESAKKANLAEAKNKDCVRRLNNVEEVVAALDEVCKLYDEALKIAHESLNLISPYPDEESKNVLKKAIEAYQAAADRYKKEATEWPTSVVTQKTTLKQKVTTLKEDSKLLTEKGLKRSCYELQKQAVPLLEKLIESSTGEELEFFKHEIGLLKVDISAFEKESDNSRLTDSTPLLSPEEFKAREKERKDLFFKSDFLLTPDLFLSENLKNAPFPRVVPLDGQKGKKEGNFTLYTEQFYRFLVQSQSSVPELFVKVHENGQVIHVEKISLPFENTQGWEAYLKNGMLFIPETKLKSDFGLDLRLSFACDPANKFSMIVAQKSTDTRYQFSVSLNSETSLYECSFSAPPPWQLESLRKPALVTPNQTTDQSPLPSRRVNFHDNSGQINLIENFRLPILDKLVEELKNDPFALASYVQNEIAFVDPYLHQENGVFHAPNIHRNPCMTYLEKQGSAWEQCQLLVYLLRKAGYMAVYATGGPSSLPKDFVERMLFTKLPEEQSEVLLQYPWVVFFDGNEWVSLFPWMKEIQIQEGHDLYSYMPEEYASANRWILRYLKGDERILKHIGPDGDDTAGVLFVRFVEEELRKQGLSLSDVGIHRTQVKKQFSSWKDFPHPAIPEQAQILTFLNENSHLFAKVKIELCSHQNPQKSISRVVSLARLSTGPSFINFSSHGKNHQLHLQIAGENVLPPLELDESDHLVDVKIDYEVILGTQVFTPKQTFSVAKGTTAALCSHFGGASPKMTSQFYEQFSEEKDEKKRLPALLSFVGSSYFEKCSRAEKILARLHKVNPATVFAFGLSKLSPDLSKGAFRGDEDLVLPQVDMFWFQAGLPTITHPSVWHQEFYTARMQCASLITVDSSSNEHQILREVFKDPYAVSTVKLLQLAHQQQQKNGLEGEGFLSFTASSFEAADKTPEAAQSLYFSHLKDLNLRDVKAASPGQWNALKDLLDPSNPLSSWSYAYMTPGLTFSQDGSYKEMGTLILCPYTQYALISSNNLIFHGGLGSPLPPSYFTPYAIREWQLVPTVGNNSYMLDLPAQFSPASTYIPPAIIKSQPGTNEWTQDVRPWYKNLWNCVEDPIDVVTGAFYADETDLILHGPLSLSIRRNYNSQNPLINDLGCGWKLSLNPSLIDQDGKRFAAELDGTVIVYSYNRQTDRWEVSPEDNPELSNFNQQGIGSSASPFHSYIENDVLYGADGSKRFYENGLLQKWVDTRGNSLSFSYQNEHLSRIESSKGDFCGVHYNHEGNISEIYAKDGRRISYDYDSQGDLVKVTLPNTAEISYEYDRNHRIIRETKPHGKVLENIYDDQGRVKEQRSPMGLQQEVVTTATFEYADGKTIVTDAEGGKTTYQIYDKQIYKITDPLGFTTLQAWFIDKESWFDPETEQVVEWNQKGGAVRSLKSTTDKRGLTTSYLYDNRGNPELITLEGEDLTGSGESKVTKTLAYNERNLCIKEEVYGQKTLTAYDSTFPYLPKRIEKYSENTLTSYIDFDYNSSGQLEKEDRSGSITIWHYNDRGFPREKIQVTGTEDPDVVTTYAYNHQGQCIEITAIDGTQENDYDLMGNQTESKVFSPSGELIATTYIGYDLNSAPTWKQTANSENIIYFDYHASGLIKAKRQSLTPSRSIAYTLYEYNPCGYLIEETDPRGYVTYRDYDPLGRVKSETKEGHTTLFSYEAGGLLETLTSPSGAQITHHYTTNGLLKEEILPDGTKNTIVYDFLGRPILETKNDIAWEIKYDDAHHQVIRTHLKTKDFEVSEFDPRGNLIKFTDTAGYTSEKIYDSLNRLKAEINPSGKQASWTGCIAKQLWRKTKRNLSKKNTPSVECFLQKNPHIHRSIMEQIIAQAKKQFDDILSYVQGTAQSQQLNEIEKGIFYALLKLGMTLLLVFFQQKGTGYKGKTYIDKEGVRRPHHSIKYREYLSIFGRVSIPRACYWTKGCHEIYPLDAELNLPSTEHSYVLQEWSASLGSEEPYEKAAHFLGNILKMPLWASTVEIVMHKACVDVPKFYEKRQGPDADTEKEIIVATGDGKGIVMRKDQLEKKVVKKRLRKMRKPGERVKKKVNEENEKPGKKKMSTVIGVYTIAAHERTVEDFLSRGKEEEKRPRPCNKVVQATLEGKESAFQRLKEEVAKRDPKKEKQGVALVDGEHKLRQLMKKYLPWFLIIIDIYHVMEYLWRGAHVFHKEGSPEAASWMTDKLNKLLSGKVKEVIIEFKGLLKIVVGERQEQLHRVITYLENGKNHMRYDIYLKRGYPIGSGVVEGACKNLVKDRMEQCGMRWTIAGAEAVLGMRSIQINGMTSDYWQYHIAQEKQRLYGNFIENETMELAA